MGGEPPATFEKLMRVNFLGSVNCVQTVLPGMLERDMGRILMVSSRAADFGMPPPFPFFQLDAYTRASVCLPACMSTCLPECCSFACLSVHLSVRSDCQPVYLSA
jgi:NAD(P)-dependent dehydrogenase (short-subunit alcohol dehydrogenase family)